MIWIIITAIILFFLGKMMLSYQKDNVDLQEKSLQEKFHVLISRLNEYAFNGGGIITPIDKREFNLYREGSNQIINFMYSQGTLNITWRYKYFQKEVVHKKHFLNCRNLSLFEQGNMASTLIKEMVEVINEHKRKVLPIDTGGDIFKPDNSIELEEKEPCLIDLSKRYKEAVISLLIVLAGSDQELTKGIREEEFEVINKYADEFCLTEEFTLLQDLGLAKILEMLKALSDSQKEELVDLVLELLKSDGPINKIEEEQTDFALIKIDVPGHLLIYV
ncbi:hypothetical protein [Salinimicrobium terrae]|uniref:hypothetical protein n=1 Tax=Salinimicrobium terrae TaxID=470866 RepID=UPI0004265186|nr:hypothetical protein [Salinimicrobium terrae]